MTLYTDKALLSYLSGYQSGYALASEYADDELCPRDKPDTPYNDGFIDGWNDCNNCEFEEEIGLYD